MPGSATIRRTSSTESFVTTAPGSRHLPSSHRSVRSTGSPSGKSPYWQAWSNINKLGTFIVRGGAGGGSGTTSASKADTNPLNDDPNYPAKLTEARLAAHNRQVAINNNNKYSSPYYKGLTDSSLVISRERQHSFYSPPPAAHEDDRHVAEDVVVVTSAAQLPTFVSRMKEWRRRLSFSSKMENNMEEELPPPALAPPEIERDAWTFVAVGATEVKPMRERFVVHVVDDDAALPSSSTSTVLPSPRGFVAVRDSSDDESDESSSGDENIVGGGGGNKVAAGVDERELLFRWANKYRPRALKDFICNRDKATHLQSIMGEVNCNHFIFQGPAGVGKRTMIWAMLQEAFGPERVQTKEERMTFNLKGESIKSITVNVKASSQHVEVNVSDMKGYEKHIIVELMKESHQRAADSTTATTSPSKHDSCRAIILHEADKLSADGVLYIKWMLERYKGFSKFFFSCGGDVSKLQPIRRLCTFVQLFPPSHQEIVEVLEFIAKGEGIELPHKLAARIAGNSSNNLRQAIRSFEACWRKSYPFSEDQVILTGWEDDIANIAKNIIQEQSPKQLYIIRGKLQNLIEHDVSPEFIFMSLKEELKSRLHESFTSQVDNLYKDYNRNNSGGKIDCANQFGVSWGHQLDEVGGKQRCDPARLRVHQFMRIEEFIAKFMSCYKSAMTNGTTVSKESSA
ncbi:unnamed protein product [Linum trigynum]|uniref:Replication factor C subunit 3 n=1 Tax=Linum trigynum TaxID=586398 RepID=A0AAV2DK63_9ROSI